jgi:GTP-binding protein
MKSLDQSAVSYQIVLTKTDKVAGGACRQVESEIADLRPKHVALHPTIRVTSSWKDLGFRDLRAEIAALAAS